MYQLELHIVCTSDNQQMLEHIDNKIGEILSHYSEYNHHLFDGLRITDLEIAGGVTEITDNVQKEPAILPD